MSLDGGAGVRARVANLLLLLAAGALYLLYARRLFGFTSDDAYIFFRYARNWVDGHGIVFNPGEYVPGYTSALWVAWLAGLLRLGIPIVEGAKVSGLACGLLVIGACSLMASEGRRDASTGARISLAPLLLVSFVDLPHWAVSGMDTAFFTLLLSVSVAAYLRSWRQPAWLAVAAIGFSLATLARPEGVVFAAVAAAAELWRVRGRIGWRLVVAAACYATPVLALLGWSVAYYGSALPNTFYAKDMPLLAAAGRGQSNLRGFLHYSNGSAVCLLSGLALIGAMTEAVVLLSAFVAAYLLYVMAYGGDWWNLPESFRFFVPILPMLAVLMDRGLDVLRQLLAPRLVSLRQRVVAAAAGAIFLAALLAPTGIGARSTDDGFGDMQLLRVLDRAAEPGDVLAVSDIGRFGFYSDFVILDLAGLVDPVIARELARTRRTPSAMTDTSRLTGYVFARDPRFIVLKGTVTPTGLEISHDVFSFELYEDPRFNARYAYVPIARRPPYLLFVQRRRPLPPG